MFKMVIQKCHLSIVETISSIIKLCKQSFMLVNKLIEFEKWIYCTMADVNLFGGCGGAARGGGVGKWARGGARNRVP